MKTNTARLLSILCISLATGADAATPSDVAPDKKAVRLGSNYVSISVSGGERILQGNGWPNHTPGQFPRPGNPNTISLQNYNFRMPLKPHVAAQPSSAA